METIEDNLSYFKCPIRNTIPEKTISLHLVSKIVTLGELKDVTNKVRSGYVSKRDKLPYITPSGCFYSRHDDNIISYSGIVCIDLDDLDRNQHIGTTCPEPSGSAQLVPGLRDQHINSAPAAAPAASSNQHISTSAHQHISSLKHILFGDKFLKPAFIFISPSGNGLKLFIRIKNAAASFHDDYFNAISLYLFDHYNLPSDSSCRNISRACLLCHDPEALFSPDGFVAAADLLELLRPFTGNDPEKAPFRGLGVFPGKAPFRELGVPAKADPVNTPLSSKMGDYSIPASFKSPDRSRNPVRSGLSEKLNSCPFVHEEALKLLRLSGWRQKGCYWFRPGKELREGHSATYKFYTLYGIYIFYNFSSNAAPFAEWQGYSDTQIISHLCYSGDYKKCTADLMLKYQSTG